MPTQRSWFNSRNLESAQALTAPTISCFTQFLSGRVIRVWANAALLTYLLTIAMRIGKLESIQKFSLSRNIEFWDNRCFIESVNSRIDWIVLDGFQISITHRSVGSLLASVLPTTSVHFHVHVVYDIKEILHHGNPLERLLDWGMFGGGNSLLGSNKILFIDSTATNNLIFKAKHGKWWDMQKLQTTRMMGWFNFIIS